MTILEVLKYSVVTLHPTKGSVLWFVAFVISCILLNRKCNGCKHPMLKFMQVGFEIVECKVIFNYLLELMRSLIFGLVFYLYFVKVPQFLGRVGSFGWAANVGQSIPRPR